MRSILFISALIGGLTACQQGDDNTVIANADKNESPSVGLEKDQNDSVEVVEVDSAKFRLKKALENPLDLVAFKEAYGPSNSGGVTLNTHYYYQPDTMGFYYQYMLFYGLKKALNRPVAEEDLFHKFRIQVFYYGETVGKFSDTTELLVGMECAMTIPVLGELDLYALEDTVIKDRFGIPLIRKKDYWIYQHNANALIIGLEGGNHCAWWRYVRLSDGADLSEEQPTDLVNW